MRLGIAKKIQVFSYCYWILRCRFAYFLEGGTGLSRIIILLPKIHIIRILKTFGAKIGENCDIETGIQFNNCMTLNHLIIGTNCHVGKNCFFDLRDTISIGNNVVISMQNTFITHLDMNKSELRTIFPANSKAISVSDNVYIGARSIILDGVTIQRNSVIGAGSLVNRDVQPYSLNAGIPLKFIRNIE